MSPDTAVSAFVLFESLKAELGIKNKTGYRGVGLCWGERRRSGGVYLTNSGQWHVCVECEARPMQ